MQICNRLSAKRYIEMEAAPASVCSRVDDFSPKQCNTIFNDMDSMYCICVCRRQSDTLRIKRQYRIIDCLFSGMCMCAAKPIQKAVLPELGWLYLERAEGRVV